MTHPNQLPREFRMASGGFGRLAAPFIFVLVFFFAVMLLLGSIFAGLVGGVVAAIVATGALVGILYGKFRRMKAGTLVRFSEYGVELSDTLGFRVRLGWRDITRLGQVDTRMATPDKFGSEEGVQVSVGSMKSLGVIGWGDRMLPPNAPGWMRENLDRQPRNPADGRPEVAIPLGGIDPNWTQGPMGEWVRRYRSDLLGPAQPAGPPHPGQRAPGSPAVGEPAVARPAVGQPAVGQPAVGQPAGLPHPGQRAPGSPAVGEPAVARPAVGQPAVGQPAVGQPAGLPHPGQRAPGSPAVARPPVARPAGPPHAGQRAPGSPPVRRPAVGRPASGYTQQAGSQVALPAPRVPGQSWRPR